MIVFDAPDVHDVQHDGKHHDEHLDRDDQPAHPLPAHHHHHAVDRTRQQGGCQRQDQRFVAFSSQFDLWPQNILVTVTVWTDMSLVSKIHI